MMTDEELMRMAREAGFLVRGPAIIAMDGKNLGDATDSVRKFAALVAAATKERCAGIVENAIYPDGFSGEYIAAAIRAMED